MGCSKRKGNSGESVSLEKNAIQKDLIFERLKEAAKLLMPSERTRRTGGEHPALALYHVLHKRLNAYLMVLIYASTAFAACAAHDTVRHDDMALPVNWVKPRVDLWLGDSREQVLIAHYAELRSDVTRAAEAYQQAWCHDPSSVWLQQKRAYYVEKQVISRPERCLVTP